MKEILHGRIRDALKNVLAVSRIDKELRQGSQSYRLFLFQKCINSVFKYPLTARPPVRRPQIAKYGNDGRNNKGALSAADRLEDVQADYAFWIGWVQIYDIVGAM